MPTNHAEIEEPSLAELVRSIVDQSQEFVRAEIDLIKVEARQQLTRGVIAFAVVLASGVLLSSALALVTAAIVLAQAGLGPALLAAAAVQVLVVCVAVAVVATWLRKRRGATAVSGSAVPVAAPHGTTVS